MSRVRKIKRNPHSTNFYLVDTCFLVNRYIPVAKLPPEERRRVERCKEWWSEINGQLRRRQAIVYIPDVCIAEAFKVLAKKYYKEKRFANSAGYKNSRERLSKDITVSRDELKSPGRQIRFHDISTSRDVIVAVDRFLEVFTKQGLDVQLPDLILLATAKYLIDFFRIPSKQLHIITMDDSLYKGSRKFRDIPSAFDPTRLNEAANKVFQ